MPITTWFAGQRSENSSPSSPSPTSESDVDPTTRASNDRSGVPGTVTKLIGPHTGPSCVMLRSATPSRPISACDAPHGRENASPPPPPKPQPQLVAAPSERPVGQPSSAFTLQSSSTPLQSSGTAHGSV